MLRAFGLALLVLFSGCAAMAPQPVGLTDGVLQTCPSAPHCASSDDARAEFAIPPLKLKGDATLAWRALVADARALPRVHVEAERDDYLHLTVRSELMGYVDDVEFHLRAARGEIAMRSCSRIGYYDFGVNRTRLEDLRVRLRAAGVIE